MTELSAVTPNDGELLPSVAVVIATYGRPRIAEQTVMRILDNQSHKPALMFLSCVAVEDAGNVSNRSDVTVIVGPAGLAAQRNTALNKLSNCVDIVVFFDDDFIPAADWLINARKLFRDNANLVGLTGEVVADGIKGPGLSFQDADRLLTEGETNVSRTLIEPFSPYGCNMAFRTSAIGNLRFDERLILYGWLEDRDFGAALRRKGGKLGKSEQLRGVHMGVKSGRMRGDRLGYSQIVNPIYLLKKGNMSRSQVLGQILRNFISNCVRSIAPEHYVDRRGRLRGNLRGMLDISRGRIEPERAILEK
ncbi:Glycosyltransferase, GT2 family [Methylobacterium sp. 190mf]|uniref:glycosyltransferase family 2 protein n=1 Tax=Methylobacterium sp. 190mf TaxID=1761798 RepID=UPI00089F261C|nr:glycosyltransferase family 2 protein [Methylobacterium sp. 190mf]SEG71162.1 Glycosyltransferase, GT2 family [Methylobacterium sp. 190mf]